MKGLLDECFQLTKDIKEINGKIYEIETILYHPRNQIISDMPKGKGNSKSALDALLDKREKLEKEKKLIEEKHHSLWTEIAKRLDECKTNENEKELFELRYYYGYLWKLCVTPMSKKTGDMWDENKVYRTFYSALEKMHKYM